MFLSRNLMLIKRSSQEIVTHAQILTHSVYTSLASLHTIYVCSNVCVHSCRLDMWAMNSTCSDVSTNPIVELIDETARHQSYRNNSEIN